VKLETFILQLCIPLWFKKGTATGVLRRLVYDKKSASDFNNEAFEKKTEIEINSYYISWSMNASRGLLGLALWVFAMQLSLSRVGCRSSVLNIQSDLLLCVPGTSTRSTE
jgi:hypothetical protein